MEGYVMKDSFYIVFDINRIVSMRKTPPSIDPGQKLLKIDFNVDSSLFQKEPTLSAKIEVNNTEDLIKQFEIRIAELKKG